MIRTSVPFAAVTPDEGSDNNAGRRCRPVAGVLVWVLALVLLPILLPVAVAEVLKARPRGRSTVKAAGGCSDRRAAIAEPTAEAGATSMWRAHLATGSLN